MNYNLCKMLWYAVDIPGIGSICKLVGVDVCLFTGSQQGTGGTVGSTEKNINLNEIKSELCYISANLN